MRVGLLIGGIVLVLVGFGILAAVGSAVANCPSGYVCQPNPVGLTLGSIVLIFGFILIVAGAVLKPSGPPASPVQQPPWAAQGMPAPPPPPQTVTMFPGSSPPPPGAGIVQSRSCARCGALNPLSSSFCARCGSPLG